jgi:cobalt/nickel transport system permease protein
MINTLFNIASIEELARREVWMNRIHPLVKILITLVYIICVSSIHKYDLQGVIIAGIYPVLTLTLANIPLGEISKKMVVPIVMGAGLGILNPLLDTHVFKITETIIISAGWLSFASLILKSVWLVAAALLLVSTTPVEAISYGLNLLKVPRVMTIQFLLLFRYITILVSEVDRVLTAYSMRSFGRRGLDFKAWGPLVGQLFLRTSNRAVSLYEAMKLRGFSGEFFYSNRAFKLFDGLYLSLWMTLFGVFIGMRG